jgi:hypothetical protein
MNLIVWVGFLCVNTSMAEMGSMAPTSVCNLLLQSASETYTDFVHQR